MGRHRRSFVLLSVYLRCALVCGRSVATQLRLSKEGEVDDCFVYRSAVQVLQQQCGKSSTFLSPGLVNFVNKQIFCFLWTQTCNKRARIQEACVCGQLCTPYCTPASYFYRTRVYHMSREQS